MKFLTLILILLSIYIGIEIFKFNQKVKISREIISKSKKFENLSTNYSKTLLVLVDSTGFGVGASVKEDSIAGLVSNEISATYTENQSQSGAQIKDLETQLSKIKLSNYDLVLIQIGGNDIIRFHNSEEQKIIFQKFLHKLESQIKYKKIIMISVADVGGSTLFPFFIRSFHTSLSLKYHAMFEKEISQLENADYINLYEPEKSKDLFLIYPEIYLSPDGLHPSSAGYKLWFEKIKQREVPLDGIEPSSST